MLQRRMVRLAWLSGFLFAAAVPTVAKATATFTVNSVSDVADANPGDGKCETAPGNGVCTLRAAIMEANHTPATINLPANTYTLTIPPSGTDNASTGDLNITAGMAIQGAGASTTFIDGLSTLLKDDVVHVQGSAVFISNVTIRNGHQYSVYNEGTLTMSHTTVSDTNGSGIHNKGTLTINDSTVNGNGPSDKGGGIFNLGTLTLNNSTVRGNHATTDGGGIYNDATLTINNSTVSGNRVDGAGGGIFNDNLGALTMINSTISGNNANTDGGGIFNAVGRTSLFNVTITNNQADADSNGSGTGGGIYNDFVEGGRVDFQNSIVARNSETIFFGFSCNCYLSTFADCFGTLTSNGHNIVYKKNCTIDGPVTVTDPLLDALADNGGPTHTHALLPGSPAIDGGNPGGCNDNLGATLSTDQRGFVRPVDGDGNGSAICDIGSFEFAPPTGTPTATGTPVQPPTSTRTYTPSQMPTVTATNSRSATPTATLTLPPPTASPTPTRTASMTATHTHAPTRTASVTRTPTQPPTPTTTPTSTPTKTATPSASPTNTRTTSVPSPTRTTTQTATNISTSTATATQKPTSVSTSTASFTPTPTDTPLPTEIPSATPTPSVTPSATVSTTPTPSTSPMPTTSVTPTVVPCIGDCTGTHALTVNDIITLVNIALGTAQPSLCPDGIPNGAEVNVALIVQAVNNALNGCPSATTLGRRTEQLTVGDSVWCQTPQTSLVCLSPVLDEGGQQIGQISFSVTRGAASFTTGYISFYDASGNQTLVATNWTGTQTGGVYGGTFSGTAANGTRFSGIVSFTTATYTHKEGGGRVGVRTVTSYLVTGGSGALTGPAAATVGGAPL